MVLILSTLTAASGQRLPDRKAYEDIERRIFVRTPAEEPLDPAVRPSNEERKAGRKQLRDIVTAVIGSAVGAEGATQESVRQAISTMQAYQWWVPGPGEPGLPFVHTSTAQGIPVMATAFAAYSGGFAIPEISAYIQFYSRLGGRWGLVAETGEDFEDCIFAVAPLRSPVEGQAWYLAWGRVIGATRTRLKVRLYAFDGFSLRTVWSREGLLGGQIKIESDGSVTLTYDQPPPEGQLSPPIEIIQRLRPTPKGLEP